VKKFQVPIFLFIYLRLKIHNKCKIDFLLKHFIIRFSCFVLLVNCHWNVDMCDIIIIKL